MKEEKKLSSRRIGNIAKAGAELFSKKGFAETSMEDIAAAARLSKGGIYHYFPSKTELLYYILDNFMDVVLKDLETELDGLDTGLEKVKRLIFRHVEIYPKHLAEAKALFHEAQNLPPKYFRKMVSRQREYYRITAEVLSDYFGPTVEKKQVTAITFILLGMCNSIYGWYNPKDTITPEQLSQTIFDMLSTGVCGIQQKAAFAENE